MAQNFRLSALVPEPLTFTDDGYGGDGAQHEMRTPDLFSATEQARLLNLQNAAGALQTQAAGGDVPAISALLGTLDDMLAILIPTLPAERLADLPLAAKLAALAWWTTEVAPKAAPDPLATLATVTTVLSPAPDPKPSSRASSASTGSRRIR